jgi:alkylated DNA repair dioxygenase AlkB
MDIPEGRRAGMNQADLFGEADSFVAPDIPGLVYLPDFISCEAEQILIRNIDSQIWRSDLRRRVQHYGYRYDYKARLVTREAYIGPLPLWLAELGERLHRDGLVEVVPDQAIVNEYQPGQGISPHVDCEPCFGEDIASLSLGSRIVMEFSHPEAEKKQAVLEPRSLVIFSGAARHEWLHGIPARKTDRMNGQAWTRRRRLSVTFRKVRL